MKDKIILITGGSSGIGKAMARQLADAGNRVVVCGRSSSKLEEMRGGTPAIYTVQCDITTSEGRNNLYKAIADKFGRIDVLVNNAGIANRFLLDKTNHLETFITDEWKTNFFAPVLLTRLFHDSLAASGGTLININSGLAHVPLFIEPNYCATKAALHSMTRSLRVQLARHNIKVIEVFYPAVDTPFQKGHAPDNAISPELAAREALKGINRGRDEVHVKMAGMIYRIYRLMPKRAMKMLSGFVPDNYEELLADGR
jgi:uncharacterized oxidoreductase